MKNLQVNCCNCGVLVRTLAFGTEGCVLEPSREPQLVNSVVL